MKVIQQIKTKCIQYTSYLMKSAQAKQFNRFKQNAYGTQVIYEKCTSKIVQQI